MDQRPNAKTITKTVKAKTIKLRRNQWKSFITWDLAMTSWLWHQKHSQQKKKYVSWPLSKLKTFVYQRVQPTDWKGPIPMEREKIFANHISDKGLISRMYTELLKFNNKNKQCDSNMSKELEWTFLQRKFTNSP